MHFASDSPPCRRARVNGRTSMLSSRRLATSTCCGCCPTRRFPGTAKSQRRRPNTGACMLQRPAGSLTMTKPWPGGGSVWCMGRSPERSLSWTTAIGAGRPMTRTCEALCPGSGRSSTDRQPRHPWVGKYVRIATGNWCDAGASSARAQPRMGGSQAVGTRAGR